MVSRVSATRRAQTSSESRRLLIAAAAELFAEQGFRKTTVADVADRAGISRGSIPWHFGNKDGLLEAVIDEFSTTWRDVAPPPGGPSAAFDELLDFVRQPTTRLLITLLAEAVEPGSPVHDFYADLHRGMRKWLADWTEGVMFPEGVSPEDFATALTGAIIGAHQQWRVSPTDVDIERVFRTLKVIFLQS
ncbi:HTH-type transcriptional regulator TtgR [Mycolicibacterium vanbaalenii]|uniref:HTH-type transcriptional regulator TtgR n=1 Tax=Mycolicibacterium vanbaalenii TaxID=110539 RepID=A0A5S9N341_MYCVN|nr:HTH-type transcriptional regulator TtgR [Mycolicibacterium vanbaalenii]